MSGAAPLGGPRQQFRSIPGFSDRSELPRLGKLRLGVKKQKGDTSYPTETDHFLLDLSTSVPSDEAAAITARFEELYGHAPKVIRNVRVVSNDVESTFSSAYEWWRAGKLACHGDGIAARRKADSGEWLDWTEQHPCANLGCPDLGKGKCGLISRLRVMIPDVSISGFFQIDTGSVYSSLNILNGLNMGAALVAQATGASRLTAMPFTLLRAPQAIEFNGNLNTHYIIHLQPMNMTQDGMAKQLSSAARQITAGTPLIADEVDDPPEELLPPDDGGTAAAVEPEPSKEPRRASEAPPEVKKPNAAGIYVVAVRVSKSVPDAIDDRGTLLKQGWTLYKIKMSDGMERATFNEAVYNTAKTALERKAPIAFEGKDNRHGFEITSIEVLS